MSLRINADFVTWKQSQKDEPSRLSFLDLPRELRDLVYNYALRVAGAIFIYSRDTSPLHPAVKARIVRDRNQGPSEPQRVRSIIPMALLETCQQLHVECSEVLYGSNMFRLYMSDPGFSAAYEPFVRNVTFMTNADHKIYADDLEEVSHGWRRKFWPHIVERGTIMLQRFPNLDTLTFPIKSRPGKTWRPAFLASVHKTREQRILVATNWLNWQCPLKNERLRECLHLEIMPYTAGTDKNEYEGSRFAPDDDDEWDCSEFSEAFERMKIVGHATGKA